MNVAQERIEQTKEAIAEAERFVYAARRHIGRLIKEPDSVYCSKEGGAMKRASMDLSRSLVPLRRSPHA